MTTPTDPGLQIGIELKASIDTLAGEVRKQREDQNRLNQAIAPLPPVTVPQITGASGTLDYPDLMGPKTGWAWDIRWISAQTFTAGTVKVYVDNAVDGNLRATFTTAGVTYPGLGPLFLTAGHRLVVAGSGLTGNVTFSFGGFQIAAPYVGAYLL